MTTQTQADGGDGLTRREVFRRGAAIGAGAAATVTAGTHVAPRHSPIGRARAVAPVVAVGVVALGAGAVSGYNLAKWSNPDTEDVDLEGVLEDQIYEAAMSVRDGRGDIVEQMQHEFLNPSDPQATPYGRSAWQEIRVEVARAAVNGDSQSDAQSGALEALNRQTTRSIINVTERYNTALNALVQQLVTDYEESVGVLDIGGGQTIKNPHEPATGDWISPVEASETADGHMLYEVPVDTPIDPTEIEGRDEALTTYAMAAETGGGGDSVRFPHLTTEWFSNSFASQEKAAGDDVVMRATHSALSTEVVVDLNLWYQVLSKIETAYNGIQSDLNDYVTNLYDAIGQGAIDPSDIIGPSEIADQFSDSGNQSRLAAELVAIGAQAPSDSSYRATISHPDLAADELECVFFPQLADGADPTLRPGMTLSSSDYRMAYIGYENASTGEFETRTLSGDSDLEIHDLEGVEGQESVDVADGSTAGTDGEVTVYSGDSPPEPLANPESEDYQGWQIVVSGANNQYTAPVTEPEQSNGDYVLATTSLAEGETIESIEIVPSVEYSRSVDYVADPTTVDSEQTIARMENLRQQVDDLEAALEEDDGGGGGPGLILPDGVNFGGSSSLLLLGGAAVLGYIGLTNN